MERRLATLLLLGAATAYFADMFLPWTRPAFGFGPGLNGWTSIPAWLGARLSLVLITWQLFRLLGVSKGYDPELPQRLRSIRILPSIDSGTVE
jgi:hypothetical protein